MPVLVRWHIEMDFHEGDAKTRAAVLLRLPDGTELRAHGHASRHPNDARQTRVGEELAAARTLNDLARQLLAKAAQDIEENTPAPAPGPSPSPVPKPGPKPVPKPGPPPHRPM